eukprot:CAMPEP_0167797300 /NCGR_PEP_ID=MMETSP0111_2-20121227/15564_1 /TAXON_ID=91324 /ORGANISM="Lotharella globosa, Strain CCCM811" /LENGTH=158 /DNA_ID=CAMNT_0007691363 /DNA_START=347 /DNA_END=823 /DNA_ORIENTATION=+
MGTKAADGPGTQVHPHHRLGHRVKRFRTAGVCATRRELKERDGRGGLDHQVLPPGLLQSMARFRDSLHVGGVCGHGLTKCIELLVITRLHAFQGCIVHHAVGLLSESTGNGLGDRHRNGFDLRARGAPAGAVPEIHEVAKVEHVKEFNRKLVVERDDR